MMKVAVCDHALGSIGMSWRGGGKLSVDFCKFHHVLAGTKGKSKKYYSRFSFFCSLYFTMCSVGSSSKLRDGELFYAKGSFRRFNASLFSMIL